MTTKHDNEFTLTCSEISNINYRTNSAYVSTGQSFDVPPTISHKGSSEWKITFKSGRHKTSAVSESFMAAAGGSKRSVITSASGDKTPDELNFYFGLEISFRSSKYGDLDDVLIYLGQGSYALTNNWWFGSNNLVNSDGTALLVATKSGAIVWKALLSMSNNSCSLEPKGDD
jgi:hypothetical protein